MIYESGFSALTIKNESTHIKLNFILIFRKEIKYNSNVFTVDRFIKQNVFTINCISSLNSKNIPVMSQCAQ